MGDDANSYATATQETLHASLTSVAAFNGIISNNVPTATLLILGLIQTATEMDKE
jgi:hypothetical protein